MFSYIWHTKEAEVVPPYISKYKVDYILPLLWIEHCVECAAPACYSSCKIFKPRSDGRCIRFENGVSPVIFDDQIVGGQITFRRWAKLQTEIPDNLNGISVGNINKLQKRINGVGLFTENMLKHVAWHRHRPSKVIESMGLIYTKRHSFHDNVKPVEGFLATIYNHQYRDQKFILEVELEGGIVYRNQLPLKPGWNERYIPISEMLIDSFRSPIVRLYLDNDDTGTFTFMLLDFVAFSATQDIVPAPKVKCVAWDLDNTLWDGVIGDTINGNVKPNNKIVKLIGLLDKRGVLQTIVSKNNYDTAWNKIKDLGLSDFFLFPAINWGRKSQNLLFISKELNINIDSFALIDDSEFERREVNAALPQVRTYDITCLDSLLELPEFDIPVTEESSKRRQSYLTENKRKNIQVSFGDDYDCFLKDCKMKMIVFRPETCDERNRCLELLQRSNQYNISKEKRSEKTYYDLYDNENVSLYGLRVNDKYGEYGIVGFVSILDQENRHILLDFVMSCRVAQKKIERAFFNWLIEQYSLGDVLSIDVRKTDRNMPLREELKKMPFVLTKETSDKICFSFQKDKGSFVDDGIIEVTII